MSRILALFAIVVSLVMMSAFAPIAKAQSSGAVEPTEKPQEINEPISGAKSRNSSKGKGGENSVAPNVALKRSVKIIAEGETASDLSLENTDLRVRGTVHNVQVSNGDIFVEQGGRLTGSITCINGKIHYPDNPEAGSRATGERSEKSNEVVPATHSRFEWVKQQVGVLIMGLLGCGLMVMAAPNAAVKTSRLVTLEPGRCLLIGLIGGAALWMIGLMSAALLHTPLRLIWSPFGFVIATLSMTAFAFGWLNGLRRLGDFVALKTGKPSASGFTERTVLGLVAAFALTTFAGLISSGLGHTALFLHWGLALMGLGGLLLTRLRKEGE